MECEGYSWPPPDTGAPDVADEVDTGDLGPVDTTPVDGDVAAPDVPTSDVSPAAGWVGAACKEDKDCTPGTCFTKEFLAGLGADFDVPNGMCSMFGCPDAAACGDNGICYDTSSFSGMPIGICLRTCKDMAECRWEEGYTCYKEKPEDYLGACLPDGIVVAIICDDGHCDAE